MMYIIIVYSFVIVISFVTGLFVIRFSKKNDLVRVIPIEDDVVEKPDNSLIENNNNTQDAVDKTFSIFNTDIIPVQIVDNTIEHYDLKIEPVHKDNEIEIL